MLKQVAPQKENNSKNLPGSQPWYGPGWLVDLGTALLITLFFARNLAANLLDKLPVSGSDIYENLWNYWQWKHLLFERHLNPFFTDYIYYPTGISLYLHTYQPLVSLQAVAAQAIFGQILGVNLVILVALSLTTWSSQQLFLYISHSRLGAWVGALVFVWCDSWYWNAIQGGNVDLMSMYWVSFYLLFLFKALEAGRERRQWWFWGLALGCLVGSSFTAWYYTLHLLLLTGLIGLFYVGRRANSWRERGWLVGKLTLMGLLWLVIVSPLLINMVQQSSNRLWYVPSQSQTVLRSVDLLSFVIPNAHNPLYGWLFQNAGGLYNSYNPSGVDGSFNPGYLPLLLAGLALLVGLRRKTVKYGLWILIGLVFAILALGPQLHFNGGLVDDPKLPYWYLYNLPGLNVSRDPSRFAVPYILALAALASLATPLIYNWIAQRWPRSFKFSTIRLKPATAFSVLLIVLIGLEFAPLQIEMGLDKVPEFYRTTLAADKDEYAILEVPSHVQDGGLEHRRMYYQTFHHKKLLGGQFARDHKRLSPTDFLSHSPFFPEALLDEDITIAPTESDFLERPRFPEMSAALLGYFDIRYIVVYPGAVRPEEKALAARFLQRALGPDPTPIYSDSIITVYQAPPAPKIMPKVISEVGQGWFQPNSKDGQSWRWGQFGQSAEIYLENLTKAPLKVRLDFLAFSYVKPRDLRLTLNYERDLQTFQLPATPPDQPRNEKPYTLEVELKPGNNILTMFTFEQPVIPNTVSRDPDGRKLSYGIRAFKVTPL